MRQGPFLELSIRGERENRKIGTPSSTRILSTSSVRDRPRRYWQAQAAPASGRRLSRVLGARGLREELFRGARDLIVSSRSVCPQSAETADSADIKYGQSQDAQAPTNGQLPLEPCPFCDRPVAQPNECCSASRYHGQTNRQEEIHL
jgi:hypothetical protein